MCAFSTMVCWGVGLYTFLYFSTSFLFSVVVVVVVWEEGGLHFLSKVQRYVIG